MHSSRTQIRAKGPGNIPGIDARFSFTKLTTGALPVFASCECVGASAIRVILTLAVLSALLLVAARPAQGQDMTLYNFTGGSDGGGPQSSLTFDSAGNFYGTTYSGGLWGHGTVYELLSNGNGGWNETVLYSFTGGADGGNPTYASVMFDSAGNLYGTAYNGGANGYGVVFELTPEGGSWTETVLHSFAGGTDGANPVNGLIMDGAGNLYGKTYTGGWGNYGLIFELSPSGGVWTNQPISSPLDGSSYSGLTMFGGDIYTTAYYVVLQLSPNGNGGWTQEVIHNFSATGGDGEGAEGTPVLDGWGNVYGTTMYGGGHNLGTLYMLQRGKSRHGKAGQWIERILHSFAGGPKDGATPQGGLLFDSALDLYGTTAGGGENGRGTIFGLMASSQLFHWYFPPPLWSFNGADGTGPSGGLTWSSPDIYPGDLYGVAGGGSDGAGVVFEANGWAQWTTTSLTSSPNPSIYGEAVTFSAQPYSSQGVPPDGETVTFVDGKSLMGTAQLSGRYANFTISTLKAGAARVTASYAGDWNFIGSTSKTLKQMVGKAATTTTVVSSQNPSNVKQSVTFTATVTPQFSGTPTGTMLFYDGTTALGSKAVKGGVAQFTTSKLASGTHTITATYNGSPDFTGSSASLTQTVN